MGRTPQAPAGVPALLLDRSGHDVLFVQFRNHVPQARTSAHADVDVRWGAGVIEDAGLTTCDVVHGFGGGYLPPVIASRSHGDAPLPDQPLAAGMTVVVQPTW